MEFVVIGQFRTFAGPEDAALRPVEADGVDSFCSNRVRMLVLLESYAANPHN